MSYDETMDLSEVATFLGATSETVAQFARNGELPGAQIGKGWIFLREDVVGFLRQRISQETVARRTAKLSKKTDQEKPETPVVLVPPRRRTRRTVLPTLVDLGQR
jgi:excisionase family DNA binding protein